MRELSVITYPHLRILPITSADNPRNISPQFTCLNIRTSAAPHIRILPEAPTVLFASVKYYSTYSVLYHPQSLGSTLKLLFWSLHVILGVV